MMESDHLEQALRKSSISEALIEKRHVPDDARSESELLLKTTQRASNYTLRWAIETEELFACVRDPETGDVLRLPSEGWVDWDDDVPALLTSNFIVPGEYDSIGPSGTFIRGALRPVFLLREAFETWLKGSFAALSPTDVSPSQPAAIKRPSKAHRLEATKEAILAIWGHGGPLAGISEDMRQQKISEWLKENGRVSTSKSTIGKAIRILSSS